MKKYLLIPILFIGAASVIFAHAMFLELTEPGVFQVQYDGGGFTPGTTVILYSDAGITKIAEGVVDDEGFYKFDPALNVVSAEAADGAGHIAYWDAPLEEEAAAETKKLGKAKRQSKIPTVLTVLNTCALIYLFFEFRHLKKRFSKNN